MSIKVHHGYRLAPGVDVLDFIDTLQSVMNPVRDRLDATALLDVAIAALDDVDFAGRPRPGNELADAARQLLGEQRQISDQGYAQASMRRDFDPHNLQVSFLRDTHTGDTLALLNAQRADFTRAWEELEEVEEYGYWNNTDAPEHVSEEEWSVRRAAWLRVLPDWGAPVGRSVSFTLRSPGCTRGLARLARPAAADAAEEDRRRLFSSCVPSVSSRARRLARQAVIAEMRRQNLAALTVEDVIMVVSKFAENPGKLRSVTTLLTPLLHPDPVTYLTATTTPASSTAAWPQANRNELHDAVRALAARELATVKEQT